METTGDYYDSIELGEEGDMDYTYDDNGYVIPVWSSIQFLFYRAQHIIILLSDADVRNFWWLNKLLIKSLVRYSIAVHAL